MPPRRRRSRLATALEAAIEGTVAGALPTAVVAILVGVGASLGAASAWAGASASAASSASVSAEVPRALPLHARIVSSTPADGSTVGSVSEVRLEFSEDVNPDFVAVTVEGPAGQEASGTPSVRGREVTQALAAGVAAGEHVVTFRVVSADGHPVSGTVTFETTQTAAATPAPSASATTPTVSPSSTATATSSAPSPGGPASDPAGAGTTMPSLLLVALGVAVLLALGGAVAWASRRGRHDGGGDASPHGP
ncbi:MAG TPA: copper resistance CopC family protein [Ornithinibacter sp.]|nr:copper resistance CopC family protein [Ornithinibacter sp.]